jgi:hypothetical protein
MAMHLSADLGASAAYLWQETKASVKLKTGKTVGYKRYMQPVVGNHYILSSIPTVQSYNIHSKFKSKII